MAALTSVRAAPGIDRAPSFHHGVGRGTKGRGLDGSVQSPSDPLCVLDGSQARTRSHLDVDDLVWRWRRNVNACAEVGHQEKFVDQPVLTSFQGHHEAGQLDPNVVQLDVDGVRAGLECGKASFAEIVVHWRWGFWVVVGAFARRKQGLPFDLSHHVRWGRALRNIQREETQY